MNLFDALPYLFRGLQEKQTIEEAIPRLKPYGIIARSLMQMVEQDKDLWLKLEAAFSHVFPDSGAAPALPNMVWVQNALNAFGAKQTPAFHIPVDGINGEHTNDAVKIFQRTVGIEVDGWFMLESYIEMITWLKKNGITIA